MKPKLFIALIICLCALASMSLGRRPNPLPSFTPTLAANLNVHAEAPDKSDAPKEDARNPRAEPITDIKTQLEGTSWKAEPDTNVRPGLYPILTFKRNNVEPAGYRYQIDSHDFTVRVYFNHGDTQLMLLRDNGRRLGFTFQGKDYSYALTSHSESQSAEANSSPTAASEFSPRLADADHQPSLLLLNEAPAPSTNSAESPETAGLPLPKMLRIAGTIDGSGRIVFTRYSVIYEHKHWSRPTDMTFDGEPWNLLRTPESWDKLGGQLDLTKAWVVKRSGRDAIALEHTADGFDLYLCDSPNGAAFYEVIIAIPRR